MAFSRRHYRLVSPPADTPADIADRKRRNALLERARLECEQKYPVITVDNFDAVNAFREQRFSELLQEA